MQKRERARWRERKDKKVEGGAALPKRWGRGKGQVKNLCYAGDN